MSLVTRLLGSGMCLLGSFAIGYAQGIQSIVDAVNNIVYSVGATMPSVGSPFSLLISGFIEQAANPAYGSYWAFGILLVVLGVIFVMAGDRKPRDIQEAEPLLPPSSEPPI